MRSLYAKNVANEFGLLPLLAAEQLSGFCSMFDLVGRLVEEQYSACAQQRSDSDIVVATTTGDDNGAELQLHGSAQYHPHQHAVRPSSGPPRSDEVAMLLSGGVDSSVALRLLLDRGCAVRAYYLRIWLEDELAHLSECPWEEDLRYARAVCDQLGVPLEVVSLQREYSERVVSYTLAEARAGRTPNPDILCNSAIKFGVFNDYIGR